MTTRFLDHLDQDVLRRFPALGEFAEQVGGTPLMEMPREAGAGRVFAKLEGENPSGSVKDRVSFAMLYRLLRHRDTTRGLRVLEYSGGSLAFSLAHLCRKLGVPLTLVLSSATPPEAREALYALGAEILFVDKEKGFYAVIQHARELARQDTSYTFLYQHRNPANLWAHRLTTGREVACQLRAQSVKPDAWVASIGTGGTLRGTFAGLKREFPDVLPYEVSPAELPYGSEQPPNGLPKFAGSGGFGCGIKQPLMARWDRRLADHFTFGYDQAIAQVGTFAQATGLRIGSSAAANLMASRLLARRLGPDSVVATVFPNYATVDEWRKATEGVSDAR